MGERQPTSFELAILRGLNRLEKHVYEGTARWDPERKRKRQQRTQARKHQRVA